MRASRLAAIRQSSSYFRWSKQKHQDRSKYTPAGPHRNCNHAGISPKQVLRKSTGSS